MVLSVPPTACWNGLLRLNERQAKADTQDKEHRNGQDTAHKLRKCTTLMAANFALVQTRGPTHPQQCHNRNDENPLPGTKEPCNRDGTRLRRRQRYSSCRSLSAFRRASRARLGTILTLYVVFFVLPALGFTILTHSSSKTRHLRERGSTLRGQGSQRATSCQQLVDALRALSQRLVTRRQEI